MSKTTTTKNRIRIRIRTEQNAEQVFKAIITHPMETGYRREYQTGLIIPADYIEELQITVDGRKYIEIGMGENVSKDPFIAFTFSTPLVNNQKMQISWIDNSKIETSYECIVMFDQSGTFSFDGNDKASEVVRLLPEAGPACKTKTPVVTHSP